MNTLFTSLALLFMISVGQIAESITKAQWTRKDLSSEERDELVELSKREPFHKIAPVLVGELFGGQPRFGIVPEGDKPWNNDGLSPKARTYLMAHSVWQHHMHPRNDPSKAKVLVSLLQHAEFKSEKSFLIRAMMHHQWLSASEEPLATIAGDLKQPLVLRRLAVEALLDHCEINTYMPRAVEIVLAHEKGLSRCQAFNFTTNQGNRLLALKRTNRAAVITSGFNILEQLPKKDLQIGYFVARRLGFILKVKNEFAPDQKAAQYQSTSGLKDEFFVDTVTTALKWWSSNKQLGDLREEIQKKSSSTYLVADIAFNAHDDVEMFGRLVLPRSKPPRAVVIAVQTAEGATVDMKRPLGGGKTFNYYDLYRDKLTAMDIGFFSYEGRGIRMGDEPPRYELIDWNLYNTSTLDNKVKDLVSAIETVQKHRDLQKVPILLLGSSEGTLLAAEAATRKPDSVSGLVLYGVLVSNLRETFRYIMSDGEFLKYRSIDKDKDGTITKSEWDKVVKSVDFAKADLNSDGTFTVEDIKFATKKYLDATDTDDYKVLHDWAKFGAAVSIPKDWFKDHFTHADNWSFLSQLDIPVGCFHGGEDRMTPISAVKELEVKAKKAELSKMEFHYFEDLDHSLKIGQYFVNGKLPKGHRAIFEFIDRISPTTSR